MATVGALLIAVGQLAEGLRSAVAVARDWLRRRVGILPDGPAGTRRDALELLQASAADQEQLIRLSISGHATGEDAP